MAAAVAAEGGPRADSGVRPWVSGIWLGTTVYGATSGVLVNALNIGSAARSSWFIGAMPSICSMVRTTLSWV